MGADATCDKPEIICSAIVDALRIVTPLCFNVSVFCFLLADLEVEVLPLEIANNYGMCSLWWSSIRSSNDSNSYVYSTNPSTFIYLATGSWTDKIWGHFHRHHTRHTSTLVTT